jgi:hypothetical protein
LFRTWTERVQNLDLVIRNVRWFYFQQVAMVEDFTSSFTQPLRINMMLPIYPKLNAAFGDVVGDMIA